MQVPKPVTVDFHAETTVRADTRSLGASTDYSAWLSLTVLAGGVALLVIILPAVIWYLRRRICTINGKTKPVRSKAMILFFLTPSLLSAASFIALLGIGFSFAVPYGLIGSRFNLFNFSISSTHRPTLRLDCSEHHSVSVLLHTSSFCLSTCLILLKVILGTYL